MQKHAARCRRRDLRAAWQRTWPPTTGGGRPGRLLAAAGHASDRPRAAHAAKHAAALPPEPRDSVCGMVCYDTDSEETDSRLSRPCCRARCGDATRAASTLRHGRLWPEHTYSLPLPLHGASPAAIGDRQVGEQNTARRRQRRWAGEGGRVQLRCPLNAPMLRGLEVSRTDRKLPVPGRGGAISEASQRLGGRGMAANASSASSAPAGLVSAAQASATLLGPRAVHGRPPPDQQPHWRCGLPPCTAQMLRKAACLQRISSTGACGRAWPIGSARRSASSAEADAQRPPCAELVHGSSACRSTPAWRDRRRSSCGRAEAFGGLSLRLRGLHGWPGPRFPQQGGNARRAPSAASRPAWRTPGRFPCTKAPALGELRRQRQQDDRAWRAAIPTCGAMTHVARSQHGGGAWRAKTAAPRSARRTPGAPLDGRPRLASSARGSTA